MYRSYFDATPYHLLKYRSHSYYVENGKRTEGRFRRQYRNNRLEQRPQFADNRHDEIFEFPSRLTKSSRGSTTAS